MPESARLYDEEAARAASAGPFVLPPARGATEGAEVGQRLAVLESQILRDLEGGDQRGVKRTTSGEKGLTLPAVLTPPLPEPGEEVVQQSREAVAPTPEDRKSLLRVRLEGVRAASNATKPRRLHHGGRKDVLRTMAIRAMIFVAEGEERERKRTRKEVHTRRQQERKRKSLCSGSSAATSESDTSNSETAMGRGSRSKIMRAVEDRPGELMTSFGDQILQYVTDETKMRAPLEERGRMIDVANLASKYYAALRAEAKEKINPGQHAELRTLAEALDALWAGQLGRAGDQLSGFELSPQPALEERLHSVPFAKCQKGPLGSPTARVVRSPAEDREDDQATPVTAAGDKEVPTNANAPTRVWLGDLPQGVSLPPDCVYIGRNMGKHIRSVGWGNPFCCGRHPTAAKRRQAVVSFRKYLSSNKELLLRLEELGGKRLACHCPSGVACHGDALIEAWIKNYGHHNTHLPACADFLTRNGRDSPSGFMWSHGGDVLSMGLGLQSWLRSSTSALGQFAQR